MKLETRRTVVLPMSHLRASTVERLRTTPLKDWPVMGAPIGPDMLLCWAPTCIEAHDLPADLESCLVWARRQDAPWSDPVTDPGFEYVIFDRDVDPVETGTFAELPVYDGESERVPDQLPPAPWAIAPGEFWGAQYGAPDVGGQRMRVVQDSRGAPVAWVLADEDDAESDAALEVIASAPEILRRYRALVDVVRKLGVAVRAYDQNMGDEDRDDGPQSPTGDDYNEVYAEAIGCADAAERIVSGR